jgi:hypothetical protein
LVALPDGTLAGRVEDLIVDTDDMSVKYLELKVLHEVIGTEDDTYLLVPINAARLDDEADIVVVDRLPTQGIEGAPRFARGVPTRDQERAINEYYEPTGDTADATERRTGDHRRFWGQRRAGRDDAPYLARDGGAESPIEAVVVEAVVVDGVVVEPPAAGTRERQESARPRQQDDARP